MDKGFRDPLCPVIFLHLGHAFGCLGPGRGRRQPQRGRRLHRQPGFPDGRRTHALYCPQTDPALPACARNGDPAADLAAQQLLAQPRRRHVGRHGRRPPLQQPVWRPFLRWHGRRWRCRYRPVRHPVALRHRLSDLLVCQKEASGGPGRFLSEQRGRPRGLSGPVSAGL